jgi:hypothetical protein
VHIDIGTIEALYDAQKSQNRQISKRDSIEVDDWEKMFVNHPIHQQLKSAFNLKTK